MCDGGSNLVSLLSRQGYTRISCLHHAVNLAVRAAFTENQDLVTKTSSIVGHFKHSAIATAELKQLIEETEEEQTHLIQKNVTRWYSTFNMWERMLNHRASILMYQSNHPDKSIATIEPIEWGVMKIVCESLKTWKRVTTHLESQEIITCI